MSSEQILWIILGLITLDFILDTLLDLLNDRRRTDTIPDKVKDIYEEDKYKKSVAYQRTNSRFGYLSSTLSFIGSFVMIYLGIYGWLDGWLRGFFDNSLFVSLAFFGVVFIAADILSLPFQLYGTFVIEEKFGFNKITPKLFVVDKLKGYLMTILIGGILLTALIYLIESLGANFWIYFWILAAAFILFTNMFYTSWILPLFNKLSPLEEGSLKDAITKYSQAVNFPLSNIYVIDGSKRSSKANAFFSGIGRRKKIVLYDTLIEDHSEEELVAVLAHEVGHFKKKHIIWSFILSILQIGFTLFVLSFLVNSPVLSQALGGSQPAIHLNLLAFGILYSPISEITGLFMNGLSRKNEYEADAFATSTYDGRALGEALKRLSVNNLSNLNPHPWYVFFHYSHPTLLQRLEAIDNLRNT